MSVFDYPRIGLLHNPNMRLGNCCQVHVLEIEIPVRLDLPSLARTLEVPGPSPSPGWNSCKVSRCGHPQVSRVPISGSWPRVKWLAVMHVCSTQRSIQLQTRPAEIQMLICGLIKHMASLHHTSISRVEREQIKQFRQAALFSTKQGKQ